MEYIDPIAKKYAEQLDENWFRNLAIGGAIGASAFMATHNTNQQPQEPDTQQIQSVGKEAVSKVKKLASKHSPVTTLAEKIKSKYNVSHEFATKVATLAKKHEKEVFPKAEDILSIAGIESSFDPSAKSGLKKDPAIGLMQVRPKTNGLEIGDLTSVEGQIKHGSEILHANYQRLHNVDDAVHAYNVGVGNIHKKDKQNLGYVKKFKEERKLYKGK